MAEHRSADADYGALNGNGAALLALREHEAQPGFETLVVEAIDALRVDQRRRYGILVGEVQSMKSMVAELSSEVRNANAIAIAAQGDRGDCGTTNTINAD